MHDAKAAGDLLGSDGAPSPVLGPTVVRPDAVGQHPDDEHEHDPDDDRRDARAEAPHLQGELLRSFDPRRLHTSLSGARRAFLTRIRVMVRRSRRVSSPRLDTRSPAELSAPGTRPRDPPERPRAAVVARERRQLDRLAVELEPRADDAGPAQPHVLAEPGGRPASRLRRADLVDERRRSARPRSRARRAARARRAGSRRGASARGSAKASGRETASRQRSSPSASTAPHWPGASAKAFSSASSRAACASNVSRFAAVSERTPIRDCFVAHLVPDVALREPACERLSPRASRPCAAAGAECEMCGAEPNESLRAAPAPLLDARDGDRQLRAGADEDADVEDPVLLRADELLAVVEQHGAVGGVLDEELGHASPSPTSP